MPYVIDNYAQTPVDLLDDLLHSDAVHALDVATASFNVGVTHFPESCTGLSHSKKLSSAQALSSRRHCTSFREATMQPGRGQPPGIAEPHDEEPAVSSISEIRGSLFNRLTEEMAGAAGRP